MARKRKVVEIKVRLYPGQDNDTQIIAWLAQFDDAPYGTKQQAVKTALLRGIDGKPAMSENSAVPTDIDWSMLRQVVDSAVQTGLAQIQVVTSPAQATDEPTESAVISGGNHRRDVRIPQGLDGRAHPWGDAVAVRVEETAAKAHVHGGDVVGGAQRIDVLEGQDDVAFVSDKGTFSGSGIAFALKHLDRDHFRIPPDPAGRRRQHSVMSCSDSGHERSVEACDIGVRAVHAGTGANLL